jgi:hypothetical protein
MRIACAIALTGRKLTFTASIKNSRKKRGTQKVESVAGKIEEKDDGEETEC